MADLDIAGMTASNNPNLTLFERSIDIAQEYVSYALASGLTTGHIAYSLGYPQSMWPTENETIRMVAFKWRMSCAP